MVKASYNRKHEGWTPQSRVTSCVKESVFAIYVGVALMYGDVCGRGLCGDGSGGPTHPHPIKRKCKK